MILMFLTFFSVLFYVKKYCRTADAALLLTCVITVQIVFFIKRRKEVLNKSSISFKLQFHDQLLCMVIWTFFSFLGSISLSEQAA